MDTNILHYLYEELSHVDPCVMHVLQCLGDETPLCDFAIQLCVSTIYWTVHINLE